MSALTDDVRTLVEADAALAALEPTPFVLPITGLEAVVAGTVRALGRGSWWVPGLRERVGAVLRGAPVERLVDGFAGARPYKVAPPSAAPALRALHAVGLALGSGGAPVAVHLGIGSVSDGAFHEALNLAALQGANVVFVVAVPPLDGAPVPPQTAASPADLARAYGATVHEVSGHDAQAVHDAVEAAGEHAGPSVVVADLSKTSE